MDDFADAAAVFYDAFRCLMPLITLTPIIFAFHDYDAMIIDALTRHTT